MRHKTKSKPKQRRVRGPTRIRKTEITRAIAGVRAAGLTPGGVEIDPISGKIRVLVGEPAAAGATANNPWDEVANDQAKQERPAEALRVQHRPAR
jgi:hypothetical protein